MHSFRRYFVLLLTLDACASLPLIGRGDAAERWAFTAPWDARSSASVSAHAGQLNGLVVGWIALDTASGMPQSPYPEPPATAPGVRRMALVTSYAGDRFRPATVRRLAMDPAALAQSARAIGDRLGAGGYQGVVLDLEGMSSADTTLTQLVVAAIAAEVHARGPGPVIVAVPPMDTTAYPARIFARSADLLLVMLYDEHWSSSPPGPVASPPWLRHALALRVEEVGASRLVAGLPLYGYQWRPNAPANVISLDDARRLAAEAGVALERDPASGSLHALRASNDPWELWVTDADLLATLSGEVRSLGVDRVIYWRLGLEDPAMWQPAAIRR